MFKFRWFSHQKWYYLKRGTIDNFLNFNMDFSLQSTEMYPSNLAVSIFTPVAHSIAMTKSKDQNQNYEDKENRSKHHCNI